MKKNLYDHLPDIALPEELVDLLAVGKSFKLQRIVSTGQTSPESDWYDQDMHEWVILLSGGAKILFEEEKNEILLEPGDYLHIRAHQKHRVIWTDRMKPTVWLALYYES